MPRGVYERKTTKNGTTTAKTNGVTKIGHVSKARPSPLAAAKFVQVNRDNVTYLQEMLNALVSAKINGVKIGDIDYAIGNAISRLDAIGERIVPTVQEVADVTPTYLAKDAAKTVKKATTPVTKTASTTVVKKKPGPKPGFKKTKVSVVPQAAQGISTIPGAPMPPTGMTIASPFNAPQNSQG